MAIRGAVVTRPVTAAILYDLVYCPHRVTMDLFGDPTQRDQVSPFVQLLWERGHLYEQEVIEGLGLPFLNLSSYVGDEKERYTLEAMERGELLIYGGRIRADDLLGNPDLLRRHGDGYVPGDIKSGSGEEGPEDLKKPKIHYAVQLAMYVDILERLGRSTGRQGFIWDIHGEEVIYNFTIPQGPRKPETLWDEYQACLAQARAIVTGARDTLPAYASGICKNCHWYTACMNSLEESDDLTLIPELGRATRDVMLTEITSVRDLAVVDPARFVRGTKTIFPRVGPNSLNKFRRRARLLSTPNSRPYLKEPVTLAQAKLELFFDIEVDPMRDHCYLHGFLERHDGDNASERYVAFFAETPTPEAEGRAFTAAWRYLHDRPQAVIYYYSKYERTWWRNLRQKHPNVCTEDEVEALFQPSRAVDLYYDVVLPRTEWPTHDFSIKTLAKFLGFDWRDPHPSGAASIEWFDRWVKAGDPAVKNRILAYNEDDCRATRVLLDGVRNLPVQA